MAKSAQQRIQNNREGSSYEVLEGIHLVGEEAPSSAVDSLWRRAWGEEVRQVQARANSSKPMIRGYVGGLKKVLG